jgi:hypothetical protein
VGVAELFLLGSNPMITVLSGLEVAVEISALGIGGEEGGVLLGGHIEVLIDLSYTLGHPLRPEDREGGNSSHAHKQDIGAATRRSPKGTGLPPS